MCDLIDNRLQFILFLVGVVNVICPRSELLWCIAEAICWISIGCGASEGRRFSLVALRPEKLSLSYLHVLLLRQDLLRALQSTCCILFSAVKSFLNCTWAIPLDFLQTSDANRPISESADASIFRLVSVEIGFIVLLVCSTAVQNVIGHIVAVQDWLLAGLFDRSHTILIHICYVLTVIIWSAASSLV